MIRMFRITIKLFFNMRRYFWCFWNYKKRNTIMIILIGCWSTRSSCKTISCNVVIILSNNTIIMDILIRNTVLIGSSIAICIIYTDFCKVQNLSSSKIWINSHTKSEFNLFSWENSVSNPSCRQSPLLLPIWIIQ